MPSLTFVLPHWLYWAVLVLFPLVAMYFVARQTRDPPDRRPSLFIAYLFWLLAGFLGIHRFYLRSLWGFVFIPIFLAHPVLQRPGRATCATTSRAPTRRCSRRRRLPTSRKPAADAHAAGRRRGSPKAQTDLKLRQSEYDAAQGRCATHWKQRARWAAIVLGVMLLVDAVAAARAGAPAARARGRRSIGRSWRIPKRPSVPTIGTGEDPTLTVHTPFTDAIEWLNVRVGEYVSYWAVIAVFAYYYEVLARYVFNSPTNWVHESMFLMFGMQYMLCGRVRLQATTSTCASTCSTRSCRRAARRSADIVTSVFFFIFIGTMLWTGARFAMDAIHVDEHSFTEWGVQYWPVKLDDPDRRGADRCCRASPS